jgi:3-phenylpropionate/trans-cinnamate dioxygenase ferredoxin reductase component
VTPRAVVIVGAGLAGARAAETLRAEGFSGRVALIGEEPTPPYERPALSKGFLAGTRDEASLLLRPASFWDDREIELVLGHRVHHVDAADRRVRTHRGRRLGYDALVVATGARPRRLPLELPRGVHQLRTLADARALREELVPDARLVVVGGGFVGAEVASTARALGVRVTIVEAAPAPLVRVLGEEVGLLLAERWRAHGADVRLGAGVAGIRPGANGRVQTVVLTDGSELGADAVLVGVGVEPARELLTGAAHPEIHPAGDVVGPGHWTAAALDGASAARRILGLPALPPQPHYVWSDQFGLRLQVVGSPRADDRLELDGGGDSFAVRYLDPGGRTRAALLANRPAEASALRRELRDDALALAV